MTRHGIRGLGHVAIGVRDMERSTAFYRDVIGLSVRFDEVEEFPAYGDLPPVRRRGVYLQYSDEPDAGFLVLDYHLTHEPFGEPAQMYQVGVHHFAWWVDDVDAVVARAAERGLEPFTGPVTSDSALYGEPAGKQIRSVLIRDPDGNVVQCDQRL